jgi:hypothetical protein
MGNAVTAGAMRSFYYCLVLLEDSQHWLPKSTDAEYVYGSTFACAEMYSLVLVLAPVKMVERGYTALPQATSSPM